MSSGMIGGGFQSLLQRDFLVCFIHVVDVKNTIRMNEHKAGDGTQTRSLVNVMAGHKDVITRAGQDRLLTPHLESQSPAGYRHDFTRRMPVPGNDAAWGEFVQQDRRSFAGVE